MSDENIDITEPGIGHNIPPDAVTIQREMLEVDHKKMRDRQIELIDAAARVPEVVTDDNVGDVGDFIKMLDAARKSLDTSRVGEKEPYLVGGRTVDGWFKALTEPLEKWKETIAERLTVYKLAVEEAERRERERVADEARKEERRLKEIADKAEAELNRRAEDARIERERADEDRKRAAADAAAKYNAAVTVTVEQQKAIDDAKEIADANDEAAIQRSINADAAAEKARNDRVIADRAATAKAAELSRDRGDLGSVSSLRTDWDFEIEDLAKIPIEELRMHFTADGWEKAIRAFVRSGRRELAGVRIFERKTAQVR